MEQTNYVKASGSFTLSLESMGFITWLVFLILKVTGIWNISWFWVWFPLWFPIALGLGLFIICLIVVIVVTIVTGR